MELPPIYFEGVYFIGGIICVIIGIIYGIFIWKDFKTLTPKLPCYKSSQILFVVSVLMRGLGYIAQAIITMQFPDNYKTLYMCDPITIGLPSYLLTISYLFLFYLWISICVNLISNDSTSGLRERTKIVFNCLLIFTLTLGFVLIAVLTLSFIQNYDFTDIIHEIEVLLAIIRDFFTATIILIYSIIIIRMSNQPLCSNYKESAYFWMLLCLVIPLYIRSGSLIFFLYVLMNKIGGRRLENFINTSISAFLSEVFPCLMILITRKRSGLLSIYDSIN